MEYIILIWNKRDTSDRHWIIRKKKEEAMAVAKSYGEPYKAEIYPHNFVDNPSFFVG